MKTPTLSEGWRPRRACKCYIMGLYGLGFPYRLRNIHRIGEYCTKMPGEGSHNIPPWYLRGGDL
jgi:hypothetical protein